MFHWKQSRIEGLMAASLYEPLSETEQRELDEAIGANTRLAAEYDSLKRFAGNIPNVGLAKTPDLLPLVRGRLDEHSSPAWGFRLAYACTLVAVVAGASAVSWKVYQHRNGYPAVQTAQGRGDVTLVSQSIDQAKVLLAKYDYTGAYDVLRRAVSHQPGDVHAGEAQWLALNCLVELKQYPDAYDACHQLFGDYRDWLETDGARMTEAMELRELLTEAKKVEFASLQELDVAKRDRANTFAALERVAEDYAKFHGNEQYALGNRIAKEMVAAIAQETGANINTPQGTLAAYEDARKRCTLPNAVALLDMKMGDACRDALSDPASAKQHYERAAENPVFVALAEKALKGLN
ncbi:MAG: hypothetical protein IT366_11175 [Candidatus Hydrogenedentes bacterium]|nr:hypothetical protein [Candidatus Hydrogenedentota bacterium]